MIPPCEMKTPFTSVEIQKAAESLNNRISVGDDNLNAGFVKYRRTEINEGVANLLKNSARTGEYPKQIKQGILKPLPKPGKKTGPPSNLQPIILLSVVRTLLAICMVVGTASAYCSKCWETLLFSGRKSLICYQILSK